MTLSTTPWWTKDTVAVVTGANKGIGYEIVRRLLEEGVTVVLTARDQSRGQAAVGSLKAKGLHSIHFHQLEVDSPESVKALATWLKTRFDGIDILVNNAGVNVGPTGSTVSYENAEAVLRTNYYGVKYVTDGLLPLLRPSPAGARIVNVSSRLGLYDRLRSEPLKKHFEDEEQYTREKFDTLAEKYLEDVKTGKWDAEGWLSGDPSAAAMYSESKIFMNAYGITVARKFAEEQPEEHQILLATFCPGLTATDMSARAIADGFEAPEAFKTKTVEDGADTGVWLALLPKEEFVPKTGKFFGERTEYLFGWKNPGF